MRALQMVSVLVMAVMPLLAGVTYEAETKVTNDGKKPTKSVVKAYVDGDKARVEFVDSSSPAVKSGNWILTLDGGKTMVMVNPKDKNYMTWDVQQMMSMLSGMGELFTMKFSDAKVEMLEESDGDKILGKSTHRYKYRTTYGLEMKILGMTQNSMVDQEQESWNTTAISDRGMGAWLRTIPPTGVEGLDKLVQESVKTIKGFPLKSRTTTLTVQVDKKGKKKGEQRSISETNVTLLEEGPVESRLFVIPDGYQKVEMPAGGKNEMPSFKDLFKK